MRHHICRKFIRDREFPCRSGPTPGRASPAAPPRNIRVKCFSENQCRGAAVHHARAQRRRERFARDFAQWRAIRVAQQGLRTGSGGPITHEDRERELSGT